jgi:hypothetical protein
LQIKWGGKLARIAVTTIDPGGLVDESKRSIWERVLELTWPPRKTNADGNKDDVQNVTD